MVTGASTADVARRPGRRRATGSSSRSRRHAAIAALLGIAHVVVCVNKMDLVDWDPRTRFDAIAREFAGLRPPPRHRRTCRSSRSRRCDGDNVVDRSSEHAAGTSGPTLLEHLETVDVAGRPRPRAPARFPVQWVIRPRDGTTTTAATPGRVVAGVLRRATRSWCCRRAAHDDGRRRSTRSTAELEEAVPPHVGDAAAGRRPRRRPRRPDRRAATSPRRRPASSRPPSAG